MLIMVMQFVILYNGWYPIPSVRSVHVLIITSSEAWASSDLTHWYSWTIIIIYTWLHWTYL